MRLLAACIIVSFLMFGCAVNPQTIEDINKKQSSMEAKLELLTLTLEKIKGQLQDQKAEIEALENSSSNLARRMDKLESKKSLPQSPRKSPSKPTEEKTPSDSYVTAESFYIEGKYVEAVLAYQNFIDNHPNDNRVADAYLKQGLSLVKTGRKSAAKFFFRTVIDRFPNSPEAKSAREQLNKIEAG